ERGGGGRDPLPRGRHPPSAGWRSSGGAAGRPMDLLDRKGGACQASLLGPSGTVSLRGSRGAAEGEGAMGEPRRRGRGPSGGEGPQRRVSEEVVAPPVGRVVVRSADGGMLARAEGAVYLEARGEARVLGVQHDMGYASQGREDRSYGGGLFVTVDAEGKA